MRRRRRRRVGGGGGGGGGLAVGRDEAVKQMLAQAVDAGLWSCLSGKLDYTPLYPEEEERFHVSR